MLSSILGKIKSIAVGDESIPGDETTNDDDLEDDIVIPAVRTGMSEMPNKLLPKSNDSEPSDQVEQTEGIGLITSLDHSVGTGVIERMYQIDVSQFPTGTFEKGDRVEFRAVRSESDPQWRVMSMKKYQENKSKREKENKIHHKVFPGQIAEITQDEIKLNAEVDKNSIKTVTIPIHGALNTDFTWKCGDCMVITLRRQFSDKEVTDELTWNMIKTAVPLRKTFVGKVTKTDNHYLIDNSVYYTEDGGEHYPFGTIVKCVAIKCEQNFGDTTFNWRAIEVEKSNFLQYADPDALASCVGSASTLNSVTDYHNLMLDKFGIEIYPQHFIKFPAALIGSTIVKTLRIQNRSVVEMRLNRLFLGADAASSQFTVRCINLEPDGGLTFFPGDQYNFEVTCCPSIIGKSKGTVIFDFGEFTIGRELSTLGQTEEEKSLKIDRSIQRPNFRKQVGESDITKIINDRDRRRIRGTQNVRAPFFAQKRLPLNKVPSELYRIMKTQDEAELKRMFPTALQPLQYSNYLDKFRVSLWFEEIENDLRRRQYDMKGIRFVKISDRPVRYKFPCPGILDFQPPVNIQDTIDAFDDESACNAKYQGTILQMTDGEVICTFGGTFDNAYTGAPMTVQFNLGRTNYKRCQFAIQTAVEHLGEDILFPPSELVVHPPRITTYEDDGNGVPVVTSFPVEEFQSKCTDDAPFKKRQTENVIEEVIPLKPLKQDQPPTPTILGKRAVSLRSRFVSNTASAPSSRSAKLNWFNQNLNNEQKNAVRRIIRGQARPIPYIIFGPPGTGKTVTLVEAVMQVNHLDQHSRMLVCAPSNAAADVIAQQLAESGQYSRGDFVRLNGFLRAGQTMLDSVKPFCGDGDDLADIAMKRLIICTCMTAGQFFTLDLSVGHFTHVFVDEAGYCTEPETMVPAILLAKSKGGQLILAGDPMQLGPVLMSDVSQNCGLGKSFLERLMKRELYQRHATRFGGEKYNPLALTKLVRSYRAHPALLKLPSKMFYDSDLVPQVEESEVFKFCLDPRLQGILVREGVPIIFDGVQGNCSRERDSPSWCNIQEATKVTHYVHALIKKAGLSCDDIGIITPYRKQVEKIRTALELRLKNVDIPKVASVEEFQGGERKVIIISTVRSVQEEKVHTFLDRLAFLYSPKRFNVVITRAKALMIIVGNPHVLGRNQYWAQLLHYVIELKAYTGCNLPVFLNPDLNQRMQEKSHLAGGSMQVVKEASKNEEKGPEEYEDINDQI